MNKEIKEILKSLRKLNNTAIFKYVDGKIVSSEPASRLYYADGYYIHEGIIMKGDFQVCEFVHDRTLANDDNIFDESENIGSVEDIEKAMNKATTKSKTETGAVTLPKSGTYTFKPVEKEETKEATEEEPKTEKKHGFRNFVKRTFNAVRLKISNFLERNNKSFELEDEKYIKNNAKLNNEDEKDEKKAIIVEIRDAIRTTRELFKNNPKMFKNEHFENANELIERYNSSKRKINTISMDDLCKLKAAFKEFYGELEKYLSDKKAEKVSEKMGSLSKEEKTNKKVSVEDMEKEEKEKISKKYDEVENKVNKIEYELFKNKDLGKSFGDEFKILQNKFDSISEEYENDNYSDKLMRDLEKVDLLCNIYLNQIKSFPKVKNNEENTVEEEVVEEEVVEEEPKSYRNQPKVVKAKLVRKEEETVVPKTITVPKAPVETPKTEQPKVEATKVVPVVEETTPVVEMPKVETIEERIAKAQNRLPELERMLEEVKVSLEVCEESDKEYFTEKKEKIEKVINDINAASRRTKVEELARKTVFAREAEALVEKQEAEKREDSRRALEASNEFYRNEYISYWEGLSDDDLSPYSNVPAKKLDEVLEIKGKIRELQNKKNEILAGKERISIYDESISDEDILKLRHIGMGLRTLSNKELEVINREEPKPTKEEYIWNSRTKHFIKK